MRRALVAVAGLALAGCGHVEMHELVLRAPTAPERSTEVYFEDKPPARAYYDVALLQAVGFGDDANMESVTRALALRAAGLGCDAVVRVHVEQGWSRAHAHGVCVRWSPEVPADRLPARE